MTMTERFSLPRTSAPAPFPRRSSELSLPRGNSFTRTLTARVIATVQSTTPNAVAARMWPHDRVVAEMLERAASAPAMTNVTGWAAELVMTFVADGLQVLSGASAGVELLRQGLVLAFDRAGYILVPGLVVDATAAGFVAEGDPIPVHQLALTPAQLDYSQIASIAVLTREMIESSNAEALVSDALVRAAGLALDAALFDANAASAARPKGLRNGIATSTASNDPDMHEAFLWDLATLLDSVSAVGGPGPYALVMSPARAIMLSLRFIREAPQLRVLGSSALGNDLIAVAPAALATGIDLNPKIETSKAATLHMDTAPVAVGSAGPARSMFQTDSIAVKMTWGTSWALRAAAGVAWLIPAWK